MSIFVGVFSVFTQNYLINSWGQESTGFATTNVCKMLEKL